MFEAKLQFAAALSKFDREVGMFLLKSFGFMCPEFLYLASLTALVGWKTFLS